MDFPFKTLKLAGAYRPSTFSRRELLKAAAGIAFSAGFPFYGFSEPSQGQNQQDKAWNDKNKVIIDTDPGVDDALTIMGALAADELDILFLTTVFGNGPVEAITANTKYLLSHFGATIPVHRGCSRAIMGSKTFEVGKRVFGEHYLGALKPPDRFFEAQENTAAIEIAKTVKKQPNEVTIFALGPLTNVAMALILYPEVATLVKKIVIMGGAVNVPGNCNKKVAECNTFADPHATQIVLSCGAPITLVPLNATHKAILIESQFQAFLEGLRNEPFKEFFKQLMAVYLKLHPRFAGEKSCVLHDPLALEVLLSDGFGTRERMNVQVELADPEKLGATVGISAPDGGIEVVVDFDYDVFMKSFFEKMKKLADANMMK